MLSRLSLSIVHSNSTSLIRIQIIALKKAIGNQSRDLHRYLYTHVYGRIIHDSEKVEAIQGPSTDEWINKMWINKISIG